MDLVQKQMKLEIWLCLGHFCMNYSFILFLMSASFFALFSLPVQEAKNLASTGILKSSAIQLI